MTIVKEAAKYIALLEINGLKGRIMRVPAINKKASKTNILFIYGTHSSLERNFGMVEDLSQYGNVIVPDLPGFGGMDSFNKIDKKISLDNYADYLADFIDKEFKGKEFALASFSLGSVMTTKTLQRYPDTAEQLSLLISYGGISHGDEFVFSAKRMKAYKILSSLGSNKIGAWLFKKIALNEFVLRKLYSRTYLAKSKFENMDRNKKKETVDIEVILWQINDVKTWARTSNIMLNLNLTDKKIAFPLSYIRLSGDQYLDGEKVEENMNKIYSDVVTVTAQLHNHSPTVIARAKDAEAMLPTSIRIELESLSK